MKQVEMQINGNTYRGVVFGGNRGQALQKAARDICDCEGIDYLSARIVVAHGERGRAYAKQPGFYTMGAHG